MSTSILRKENALKKASRRSEERFKQIAESAGEWIWEIDKDGLYTYCSPAVSTILGYQPDDIVGKIHFYELVPENIRAAHKIESIDSLNRKIPFRNLEVRILHKDGSQVIIESNGFPMLDDMGNLLGYRGANTDITDRKKAEDELFNSQQMLQLVLDNIPQRIFWKDRNCVYLGCNDLLARDCGFSHSSELIGKTDYETTSAATADKFQADDRFVMETGVPKHNFEESQIMVDGSLAWLRTSKIPLRDKEGNIIAGARYV